MRDQCRLRAEYRVSVISTHNAIIVSRILAGECILQVNITKKERGGRGPGRHRATAKQPRGEQFIIYMLVYSRTINPISKVICVLPNTST